MTTETTKAVQTLNLDGVKPNQEKKCSDIVDEKYQDRLKQFETAKTFLDIDKSARDDFEQFLAEEFSDLVGYDNFFDYVNLHWYFINQTNSKVINLANKHDLGVFIISPTDKGGHLHLSLIHI